MGRLHNENFHHWLHQKKRGTVLRQLANCVGVKRVVDVRLNNVSQLSGFAKKNDLEYFLKQICGMDYTHLPSLAPTKDILDAYKKERGSWETYERDFIDLMAARKIENEIEQETLEDACLLCSEDKPHYLPQTSGSRVSKRILGEY